MLKKVAFALVASSLVLAAQSAVADSLTFYEGHGWLAQPPFSSERDSRSPTVIAGPASSMAGAQALQAVNPQTGTSPRVYLPAPYDKDGFDAGHSD